MKTAAFDIMMNGTRVGTVFKPNHMNANQVRNQLIEQEHYDTGIEVERLG